MSSHGFYPSVGGLPVVSEILAKEFVKLGHEVKLITHTYNPLDDDGRFIFQVIRKPNMVQLYNLVRWADIYHQNNISLNYIWPILFIKKTIVVTHQIWIPRGLSYRGIKGLLKRYLISKITCISISKEISGDFESRSIVIPNPFDAELFRLLPGVLEKKELVFVGRLISDKGVDLLIEALGILRDNKLSPHLTIVGDGPELTTLQRLVVSQQLENQVVFVGVKKDEELVKILNQHQILVVPSRWNEPFGIVALEGMACGCVVVGSSGGGLADAIGSAGMTFPNGNTEELTRCLYHLLTEPEKLKQYQQAADAHLEQHTAKVIAVRYLAVFKNLLNGCT